MPHITIGDRKVGPGEPTYIIGEVGINHQGEVAIAKRLVDVVKAAGGDAVKFQKRSMRDMLTRSALEKPYVGDNSFGPTYGEHRAALELELDQYREIQEYAASRDVHLLASAWDEPSVDFLVELGVPAMKVASADVTNIPLIRYMARQGVPVLLSSGMSTQEEVDAAVAAVREEGAPFAIMQCTSTYPSSFDDINLNVMVMYRDRYDAVVGYSGHERGIAVSEAAVALGASVIERHITLDRTMKGGDHAASLEPAGFMKLVRDVRVIERSLGRPEKRLLDSEVPVRHKLGKSLVAAMPLRAGTVLEEGMLARKSPGSGIAPNRVAEVLGRKLVRDLEADALISPEDLE